MDQFLKDRTCPNSHKNRLPDRLVSIKKIKSVINSLSNQKAPGPDGFTGEFYQASKKEIILVYSFFQRTEAKGILPHSFCEISIILVSKPYKDTT